MTPAMPSKYRRKEFLIAAVAFVSALPVILSITPDAGYAIGYGMGFVTAWILRSRLD